MTSRKKGTPMSLSEFSSFADSERSASGKSGRVERSASGKSELSASGRSERSSSGRSGSSMGSLFSVLQSDDEDEQAPTYKLRGKAEVFPLLKQYITDNSRRGALYKRQLLTRFPSARLVDSDGQLIKMQGETRFLADIYHDNKSCGPKRSIKIKNGNQAYNLGYDSCSVNMQNNKHYSNLDNYISCQEEREQTLQCCSRNPKCDERCEDYKIPSHEHAKNYSSQMVQGCKRRIRDDYDRDNEYGTDIEDYNVLIVPFIGSGGGYKFLKSCPELMFDNHSIIFKVIDMNATNKLKILNRLDIVAPKQPFSSEKMWLIVADYNLKLGLGLMPGPDYGENSLQEQVFRRGKTTENNEEFIVYDLNYNKFSLLKEYLEE